MTTDQIKGILHRLDLLEKEVYKKAKTKSSPKASEFTGATGGIRLLISKGYLNKKRTFSDIKGELEKNDYYYTKQAIQTPLNTLSKAGGLLVGFKQGGKKVYAKRK